MVSADGACAAPAAVESSNPEASGQPGGTPGLVAGGVGLDMSECEVVNRTGRPDNVDIGTDERGERSVTMTYQHGVRPGIYRFSNGRLVSVERAPEAAPTRQARPAKRSSRS